MPRHPTDLISLVFGSLFAVAGGLMLAGRLDLVTQAHWVLPLVVILVALGLLASASWSTWRHDDGGEGAG